MELDSCGFVTIILTLIVQIVSIYQISKYTHKHSIIHPLHCFYTHHYTVPLMSSVQGGAMFNTSHQCPRSSTKQSLKLVGRVSPPLCWDKHTL